MESLETNFADPASMLGHAQDAWRRLHPTEAIQMLLFAVPHLNNADPVTLTSMRTFLESMAGGTAVIHRQHVASVRRAIAEQCARNAYK